MKRQDDILFDLCFGVFKSFFSQIIVLFSIMQLSFEMQIRWKSDIPLTEGQLKSKRDEFWDTAPAFEGKSEIWNALKAAVEATEVNDYDLAQGKMNVDILLTIRII